MNRNQNISAIFPERQTVHIMDDRDRFAIIDTLTVENGTTLTTPVETLRYQYNNHLGTACLELDGSAAIISYEEYHPFGTTSYRSGRNEVDVSLKRYKYVGKERDEETGLYYYGARYYAAWLCRFVSVDPLQHKYPHYTPYQYAGNKPITYIDLDGLEEALPNGVIPDDKPELVTKKFEPAGGYSLGNISEGAYGLPEVTISGKNPNTFANFSSTISPKFSNTELEQKRQQFDYYNSPQGQYKQLMNVVATGTQGQYNQILQQDWSPEMKDRIIRTRMYSGHSRFLAHPVAGAYMNFMMSAMVGGAMSAMSTPNLVSTTYRPNLSVAAKSTTTVFRNFGWSEYNALKSNNMKFAIKEGGFGSKQFWLDTKGINWWESTSFSKNFTAKITVNKSALQYGTYFDDVGMYRAISFDSQKALSIFNKSAKIEWLKYK